MDTIRTATNKVFNSDYIAAIPNPAQLYVRILNTPLAEIAQVFSDPAETCQLWYGSLYFAQYTKLVALVPETNAIKVILNKE